MGASAAVEILHRRELAPLEGADRDEAVTRLAAAHTVETGGLQRAVDCGVVDAVIEPHETRARIAAGFAAARPVRGLNANIPL
jgi:acetyl-CoA/propionyl-CoA carboxylase carboxyl transferase subunit